jgi:hypothetical protein
LLFQGPIPVVKKEKKINLIKNRFLQLPSSGGAGFEGTCCSTSNPATTGDHFTKQFRPFFRVARFLQDKMYQMTVQYTKWL